MSVFELDELNVKHVSRQYGRRRALARVTFQVQSGQVVGLLGPNGAGKSTLLGILAPLIAPSSGNVFYGGKSSKDLGSVLRRQIGFLSHDLQIYPELTAKENLEFFANLYGEMKPDVLVAKALERARLSDRADDTVDGFSRGMRQRLALERALLHEPRLVLLDEPFTGLDDRSIDELSERLRAIGRAGRMVIFATHDLDVAEGVVDRALVLRSGRIALVQDGSSSLRTRYRAMLHESPNVGNGGNYG